MYSFFKDFEEILFGLSCDPTIKSNIFVKFSGGQNKLQNVHLMGPYFIADMAGCLLLSDIIGLTVNCIRLHN